MNHLVIDTNVIISGLLWGGIPGELLLRVENKRNLMFASRPMLDELFAVIQRPKFTAILKCAGLTVADIVYWLTRHATVVLPKPLPEVVILKDPADDIFLACAVSVRADFIVSGNRHLLDLKAYDGIPVVTPKQYISTN